MNFAHPKILWLLLVVPPALMLFLWWAGRTRQRLLTAFIQARLLPDLTVGISRERELIRNILLTAASAALLIALARPQWGFTLEETRIKGLHIIVAIDTSKSMLAEDVAPNRLARAKLAAIDLMQTAKSDRLGLVAFAGGAFLQCPMTIDDAAFRQSVEMLDVNTLPQGGTAIAEAIETAQAAFKEGDGHKVLVLMTDGEDQDSNAIEAARKAAESGLKIFTIGIGSAEGELLPVRDAKGRTDYLKDDAGNAVKSRLNESLLQEIATVGNGFYLPMRGAKVIETLYQNGLAPLPKSESEAKTFKHYHEQYHWPLAFAIALLLVEILIPARAGAKSTFAPPNATATAAARPAALLALLLFPMLANASTSGALHDYQAGRFDKAQGEYLRLLQKKVDDPRLALNAGTAAIRGGKLSEAESLLTKAVNAPDLKVQQQAYYNRGNTRFLTGDSTEDPEAKKLAWENSLKDFESAMKLNSKDADAKHNYEFVKQKLEELKKQEQQQKQDKNQNKDENKDQEKKSDQQQKQDQNKQDQQKSDQQKQKDQSQQDDKQKADEQKKQDQQKQGQQPKPDEPKNSGEQRQATANTGKPEQMTPEQAMRVLDTTKGDEKVLPVQLAKPPQTDKKLKDW